MDIKETLESVREAEESHLREIYIRFRPGFMSWMNTAHKNDASLAIETYKYAIASLYEAIIENKDQFTKENDIKVYLLSVAKNKLLSDDKLSGKLSYQADLEKEAFEGQEDKKLRVEKLKKLVAVQGYPCKQLLRYHYFERLSPEKIARKLDYKRTKAVDELKEKCIQRIKKLLTLADEEI